nr:uncharacterized protein LOC119178076 [Rhipicephalus microplus]
MFKYRWGLEASFNFLKCFLLCRFPPKLDIAYCEAFSWIMGAPTTSSTFWLPSHESHQVTVSNKWADQPSSVSTGRTNWLPFDRTYQDSESSTWTAHLSSVTSSTPRLEKEQHNQGTLGGHGTWPAGNMSKSALLFMLINMALTTGERSQLSSPS